MSVPEAAKELDTTAETVNSWAEILSENKIISMEYRLNNTILSIYSAGNKPSDEKKSIMHYLDRRTKPIASQVTAAYKRFKPIEARLKVIDKEISSRVKAIEKQKSDLERLKGFHDKVRKESLEIEGRVRKDLDSVNDILVKHLERYMELEKDMFDNYRKTLFKTLTIRLPRNDASSEHIDKLNFFNREFLENQKQAREIIKGIKHSVISAEEKLNLGTMRQILDELEIEQMRCGREAKLQKEELLTAKRSAEKEVQELLSERKRIEADIDSLKKEFVEKPSDDISADIAVLNKKVKAIEKRKNKYVREIEHMTE